MYRIGQGFDIHKLVEGRQLILGGIKLEYEKGLLGHSDADVLVHAIMDSLFGAAALGDIGKHFPDSDQSFKDIDSLVLLSKTVDILKNSGFSVNNIDSTIVAQSPKLSPFIEKMRENIASVLGIDISFVSVKATTTEHLGFEGRKEGISAYAVATVTQKW